MADEIRELIDDIKGGKNIIDVVVETLPNYLEAKEFANKVSNRLNVGINISDSIYLYYETDSAIKASSRFIGNVAGGAITTIVIGVGVSTAQPEIIVVAFVAGKIVGDVVEKLSYDILTFLDTHILTPIQEDTQKIFNEIFIKPVERAIKKEYFEQGFYEEYDPHNEIDRLEFYMKEYLNFNGHIYKQERYAKNDILAYNTQGYTQVTLDMPTHNLTHSKSQHIDIVNEYKKTLSQIKQDFNNYIPIQVSLTKNEKEEIFYIRKSKTTLANQQSTPTQSKNTDSTTPTTQAPQQAKESTTPNNNPNPTNSINII